MILRERLSPRYMQPGDVVVSGTMGDHGLTILALGGLSFSTPVESDCTPFKPITKAILDGGTVSGVCVTPPERPGYYS